MGQEFEQICLNMSRDNQISLKGLIYLDLSRVGLEFGLKGLRFELDVGFRSDESKSRSDGLGFKSVEQDLSCMEQDLLPPGKSVISSIAREYTQRVMSLINLGMVKQSNDQLTCQLIEMLNYCVFNM